jgi:hypothetical protein
VTKEEMLTIHSKTALSKDAVQLKALVKLKFLATC